MPYTNTISIDQQGEVVRCSHCRAKTELFVSMANPKDSRILRIFKITGLNKVFNIYDTVPESIAAHSLPPADAAEN